MRRMVWTACAVALLLAGSALADLTDEDSMRCEGGVVNTGNTAYQVMEKCGPPTAKNDGTWIYNFGPERFIYYLTFVQDSVVRIQSGGYGN